MKEPVQSKHLLKTLHHQHQNGPKREKKKEEKPMKAKGKKTDQGGGMRRSKR